MNNENNFSGNANYNNFNGNGSYNNFNGNVGYNNFNGNNVNSSKGSTSSSGVTKILIFLIILALLGGFYWFFLRKDNASDNEILVTGISFPNDTLYIKTGSSFELKKYIIISPEGAKINSITYSNQNPSVLVINDGIIQTVANGYDEIKVVANGNVTKNISVVVSDDVVSGFTETKQALSFQKDKISLSISDEKDLTTLLNNGSDNIIWKSSDSSVVMVDNTGKITGVSKGQVVITATDLEGRSASIVVDVTSNDEVQRIELNQSGITKDANGNYELRLAIGESFVLTPTVVSQTLTDKQLSFEVDNQALVILKVSDDKLSVTIMGGRKATGEATITIKSSNNLVTTLKVIVGSTSTGGHTGTGGTSGRTSGGTTGGSTTPTIPEGKRRSN